MVRKLKAEYILVRFSILAGLCTLFCLIYGAILFSSKGFEISDEAFYLFFSHFKLKSEYVTTNFGILNNFVCLGNPTLVNLRIAKLLLQLSGAAFLFYGLRSFIIYQNIYISKSVQWICALILVIAVFINYDYLPMTLSYNSWSLVLALFGGGLLLLDFTMHSPFKLALSSFLYGVITFAAFLAKFPNAFILLALFGFIHFFYIRKKNLMRLLLLFAGMLSGFFIFLHDWDLFLVICSNYYDTIFSLQHFKTHSYANDLTDLKNGVEQTFFAGLQFILLLAVIFLGRVIRQVVVRNILFYLLIGLNFFLAWSFTSGNSQVLTNDFIFSVVFVLNAFYYFLFLRFNGELAERINKPKFVPVVLLLIMPFLYMLGTNNPFYYTSSQFFILFLAGALLLVIYNSKNPSFFTAMMLIALCPSMIRILWNGAVKSPYRQTDLTEKNYPLKYDKLGSVEENYAAFTDYKVIEMVMNKLNPSKEKYFTFANYLGSSFISGAGLNPPTWIPDNPAHIENAEFIMKKCGFSNNVKLMVMPQPVTSNEPFMDLFLKFNINFKEDYQLGFKYQCISRPEIICFYKRKD